tara:strand:- start:596 stop:736 length:141 start_codon:yes stop_codon:yes gene_type:complete
MAALALKEKSQGGCWVGGAIMVLQPEIHLRKSMMATIILNPSLKSK